MLSAIITLLPFMDCSLSRTHRLCPSCQQTRHLNCSYSMHPTERCFLGAEWDHKSEGTTLWSKIAVWLKTLLNTTIRSSTTESHWAFWFKWLTAGWLILPHKHVIWGSSDEKNKRECYQPTTVHSGTVYTLTRGSTKSHDLYILKWWGWNDEEWPIT